MKKGPMKLMGKKKSAAKQKMKMVTVNGKRVPAFAADGKGANDMKKSGAKMKKAPMKVTARQAAKLPANLVKAIKAKEGSAAKMKKAAMKLKKDSMAMMKKSAMEMKKASAMKMKMKASAMKMKKSAMKMSHKKK